MSAIIAPKGLSLRLIEVGGGRILLYVSSCPAVDHAQQFAGSGISEKRIGLFLPPFPMQLIRSAHASPGAGIFRTRSAVPRLSGRGRHRLHRKQRKNCLAAAAGSAIQTHAPHKRRSTSFANAPTSISVLFRLRTQHQPACRRLVTAYTRAAAFHRSCPHHRKENIQNE